MNKLNTSGYINVSKIASENSISLTRLKKLRHFKNRCAYVEHFTRTTPIIKIKHDATYMDPLLLPAVEEYIREIHEWEKKWKFHSCPPWEEDDYFLTEWERIRKPNEPYKGEKIKDWKGEIWIGFPYGCGWQRFQYFNN